MDLDEEPRSTKTPKTLPRHHHHHNNRKPSAKIARRQEEFSDEEAAFFKQPAARVHNDMDEEAEEEEEEDEEAGEPQTESIHAMDEERSDDSFIAGAKHSAARLEAAASTTFPTGERQHDLGNGLLFNDDELFSLDDNLVRRIIYAPAREAMPKHCRNAQHIVALNFTKQCFEPGATKLYHLKDHYYELFCSVFNSLEFATGKKVKLTPSEKVVREKPQPRGRGNKYGNNNADDNAEDADMEAVAASVAKTPEIEVNNFLQGSKDVSVFIETLMTGNKVSGFRFWIFDRASSKTNNDTISLGLRESLLEAAKIQEQANKQMQVIIKNNGSAKSAKAKKAAASKQYAVAKEFSFSTYASFDRHFTGLVSRYFSKDSCLAVSANTSTTGKAATRRQFRDTRAYTTFDTVKQQEIGENADAMDYTKVGHPCNFSKLFGKEAAMFYYVNEESINEPQCRLESYFANASGGRVAHAKESAHCRANFGGAAATNKTAATAATGSTMVDVADYVGSASDKDFTRFPYESITYHIHNTFVSHEFMGRMPLPHRLGSTLYTQKDMVELKKGMGLAISPTEDAEADTELVDGNEIGDFLEQLGLDEQSETEASVFTRKVRAEKRNELKYGAVVRYMGLHHTEMELSTEVLLSQLHHVDAAAQPYLKMVVVPRDILDKFLANKRNEINSRLRLIITNIGFKHRMVVTETLTAAINTQEDTRRKSLSAASLLSSKAGSDERDQTVNIMDQIGHNSHVDEQDTNLLQLPYVSLTVPGILNNSSKTQQIKRKAFEYVRRRTGGEDEDEDGYALDPEARVAQMLHEDKEYQSKVASGKVAYYKDIIEKYRPYGNSLYTIRSQLHQTEVEEVYLGRDIFLRLAELNTVAYANLDLAFFDPETGKLPAEREMAYWTERRQLRDALTVECWHEFFENRSVSLACDGIRSDLLKQKITYAPPESCGGMSAGLSADQITGRRMIGTVLPVHDYKQELRPYAEYKTWVQSLFADQFGIAYNYKIMWILYIARLHHCRWLIDCNSPKHNVILSGTGMAGKSHLLQSIKKILPTGVGDMVTHITDQAFNVDRNMNDMLLIYEEFQNKYLGYSQSGGGGGKNGSDGGGGGGVSAGGDKDTTNFFKARLTSGATTTMSWFENEETGMRDMKISKAHCQGSMMGASNNDFTYADANVMSRFILLSVPKSKAQHEGNRPQDKHKFQFGTDSTQNKAIYEQHKEIHRVYFLVEQMIKSNVLGENEYGVNVDGGRIMTNMILDHLQKRYGISTGDVRKRDHILEMERSMALSCAVWIGLTSILTRDLQHDPHDPTKFIGFNPRVITEGIFPFMVITKDMVFDAITALSSLWYHDYQDLIVEVFATKHCQLQELRESDFLVRPKADNFFLNLNASGSGGGAKRGSSRLALTTSSNAIANAYGNAYGGGGGGGGMMMQEEKETDYNYIVMRDKSLEAIYQVLSMSMGDLIVSHNDIGKLLTDLSKCRLDNCDSYEMSELAVEYDEESGAVTKYRNRLTRGAARKNTTRPIVEFTRCPNTGKQVVAILVHFIKQKLPAIFVDELIEDLNKNERRVRRANELQDVVIARHGDMEMQVEENDYEERVRRIGMITEKDETLIIKTFKDVMENLVLEDMGMEAEEREILEANYANPSTGVVPWRVYITSDPPKPHLITDFYPELKEGLADTDDGDAPILFVDELKMLELKAKPQGRKIIIRNHNTVSASTRATLSIYKERQQQLVKRRRDDGSEVKELGPGEVLKKFRIQEYARIEAWELDRDIDSIFCAEHLRNIAFNGLPSRPGCEMINYPPCTYMAIMEEKMQENEPLFEYPFVSNMVRIANRKKHAQGLINPDSVKYPKLSRYLVSNLSENSATHQKAYSANKMLALGKPVKKRCYATEKRGRQNMLEQLMFPDY